MSNLGAARSLRIGMGIGVAICVVVGKEIIDKSGKSSKGSVKIGESEVSKGRGLSVLGVFGVEDWGVCRLLIGVRGVMNECSEKSTDSLVSRESRCA